MEAVQKECIVCGGQHRRELVVIDGWTVCACTRCGLGVVDPRPSVSELAALYDEKYCQARFVEGGAPGTPEFRHRLSLKSTRLRLIGAGKKRGRVLDIGCGYGYFLAACREKGYQVHGVDFSTSSVTHAVAQLGIPVTTGPVDDLDLPAGHFDIVTMWHSLEHMPHPDRTIAAVNNWLAPGGILVVDVPNHLSTDATRYGPAWTGWDLPYHLHHFTPAALAALLEKAGFRIIGRKRYHSQFIKERPAAHLPLRPFARLIARLYSGHSVALVARKR